MTCLWNSVNFHQITFEMKKLVSIIKCKKRVAQISFRKALFLYQNYDRYASHVGTEVVWICVVLIETFSFSSIATILLLVLKFFHFCRLTLKWKSATDKPLSVLLLFFTVDPWAYVTCWWQSCERKLTNSILGLNFLLVAFCKGNLFC